MLKSMQKIIKSFGWAINGLRMVWREETSFRTEFVIGVAVVLFGVYVHFLTLEWMIIIACIGAVLSAEILNTAIEDLCDKVEPNTDPVIGKIKDMMGGFVLVVCIASALIGLMIISNYYWL
ncbi:MAG: diacylglycerol kinase family protein [Candidatus Yonathbacteria bacterium]|nr:diacylglycerol kinase family protein [Candidatus Yonathbacteria bacterium]